MVRGKRGLLMEMILFTGIPGSGKSSFYKQKFFNSHIRINLDMLRTRNRESRLLAFCLDTSMPFVIDNTNVTVIERAKYIQKAKEHRFRVKGYFFGLDLKECIARNALREGKEKVPPAAIGAKFKQLQLPQMEEGFDELYYVKLEGENKFIVEPWKGQ